MEFKVGDKVKCIEPMGILAHFNAEDTYVVSGVDQAGIHLCFEHTGPMCWYAGRFEVIQPKQLSPKPGDKIICNNGEEFVCCTLEFLQATISKGICSDKPILGYYKCDDYETWQDWDEYGLTMYCPDSTYTIKEIIPASQQEVKQDVTEVIPAQGDNTALRAIRANESPCDVGAVFQEKTYTLEQIKEAFYALQWFYDSFKLLSDKLNESQDPEYKVYLELKAKFEGKE